MCKYGSSLVLVIALSGCGNGADDPVPLADAAFATNSEQGDAHFVFITEGTGSSDTESNETTKPNPQKPVDIPSSESQSVRPDNVTEHPEQPERPEQTEKPPAPAENHEQSGQTEQEAQSPESSERPASPTPEHSDRPAGPSTPSGSSAESGSGNDSGADHLSNSGSQSSLSAGNRPPAQSIYTDSEQIRVDVSGALSLVADRTISYLQTINMKISQGESLDDSERACARNFDTSLGQPLTRLECGVALHPNHDNIEVRVSEIAVSEECTRELRAETVSACTLEFAILAISAESESAEDTLMAIYPSDDRINVVPLTRLDGVADFCTIRISSGDVIRESADGFCLGAIPRLTARILATQSDD